MSKILEMLHGSKVQDAFDAWLQITIGGAGILGVASALRCSWVMATFCAACDRNYRWRRYKVTANKKWACTCRLEAHAGTAPTTRQTIPQARHHGLGGGYAGG